MTEQEEFDLAIGAESLLQNKTLSKLLDIMEEDFINQWQNTKTHESEKREEAYLMLQATKTFRTKLSNAIHAPKLRKKHIN